MGKARLKEGGKKENVYLSGLEPVFQRAIPRRNYGEQSIRHKGA